MAAMKVNPERILEFKDGASFYRWLGKHHDHWEEVWIKIHKVSSGMKSVTPAEAIDVALCWGWIDAIRKGLDERSYLQRYTPRGKKSTWSRINVENVARLIEEGRMTEYGLRHVEAAKADGRWERAYGRDMEVPLDFLAAMEGEPKARKMFEGLSAQNRFAILFRLLNMRSEAGRKRKVAAFVEMLKRGQTIYPQRTVGNT